MLCFFLVFTNETRVVTKKTQSTEHQLFQQKKAIFTDGLNISMEYSILDNKCSFFLVFAIFVSFNTFVVNLNSFLSITPTANIDFLLF